MKQSRFASTALSIVLGVVVGLAVAHSIQVTQAFEPFDEVGFTPVEEPEEFVAGPWYVDYIPSWGSGSAPEDGSVGIWADGWFIAHSRTINGNIISSMPETVEVDGQIYRLISAWTVGDSVGTEDISYARANNGIVFQTCATDDMNLLVHYEPINGAGYPYEFTEFPYTVNDSFIFGE